MKNNYLVICDADVNRVWVPKSPKNSAIKYLAPCTRVKKRLLLYGVPEENIFITGFPLPKENLGSREDLEILRGDLFNRLLRLDSSRRFFDIHSRSAKSLLGQEYVPLTNSDGSFTLTFAIGGAGAQAEMVYKILHSLKNKIINQKIKINLSAGTNKISLNACVSAVETLGLANYIDNGITIIHDSDFEKYYEKFNKALRFTDVLWTKPSELSFYCALGIPILLAPAVGAQEKFNEDWLMGIHAAIKPQGPVEFVDQWLFDLKEIGQLTEVAWNGFLKARKFGTFKIEDLVHTGSMGKYAAPYDF
jgi:hypothetical protein